jgi:DNA-binding SARP family transcriptional activator
LSNFPSPSSVGTDRPETVRVLRPVPLQVNLLDGFEFMRGRTSVSLTIPVQRLIAFVALRDKPLRRTYVAETLWFDTSTERAGGCLRSALWRLRRTADEVIVTTDTHVALAPGIGVDLRSARDLARSLLESTDERVQLASAGLGLLGRDLLPDWYDEWLLMEREQFRQLRLHALEALCRRFTIARRHGEAIEVGLAAVASDPLRESAHRALILAHLGEGNHAEAVRQYRWFDSHLKEELGVRPSPELRSLVNLGGHVTLD